MRKCTGKSQVSLGWEGGPKTSSQGIWRVLEGGTKLWRQHHLPIQQLRWLLPRCRRPCPKAPWVKQPATVWIHFFWQSLTVLRRYLEHQNIPIKHQTSTIMAACLGSCTATILLVDWTISNFGFKILFLGAKDQPVCYTQVTITQPFADVFPI